jgi:hypothetical protein
LRETTSHSSGKIKDNELVKDVDLKSEDMDLDSEPMDLDTEVDRVTEAEVPKINADIR